MGEVNSHHTLPAPERRLRQPFPPISLRNSPFNICMTLTMTQRASFVLVRGVLLLSYISTFLDIPS